MSVSDVELILQLTKAIQADAEKPTLDQKFNPTDPVAVMLVMYEVDFAVDVYMEKWKTWRDKFTGPDCLRQLRAHVPTAGSPQCEEADLRGSGRDR